MIVPSGLLDKMLPKLILLVALISLKLVSTVLRMDDRRLLNAIGMGWLFASMKFSKLSAIVLKIKRELNSLRERQWSITDASNINGHKEARCWLIEAALAHRDFPLKCEQAQRGCEVTTAR